MKKISEDRLKEHLEWERQFQKDNPASYKKYKENHPETPQEMYEKAESLLAQRIENEIKMSSNEESNSMIELQKGNWVGALKLLFKNKLINIKKQGKSIWIIYVLKVFLSITYIIGITALFSISSWSGIMGLIFPPYALFIGICEWIRILF